MGVSSIQSKDGEHTALLGGRLLGLLHLAMEPAGEPRFQVELASKHIDGMQLDDIIHVKYHRYKNKGISKKKLGLGIGAGFVGGAALGVAGGMATASVYQRYYSLYVDNRVFQKTLQINSRYHEFQRKMSMGGYGGYGGSYDMGYADNYYNRNRCRYGCPSNSYCRLGFCECNQGLTKIAVMNPSS